MATIFLEPGGDSTYNVALTTAGGFWDTTMPVGVTMVTDFVHGGHIKSIKYAPNGLNRLRKNTIFQDAGSRISFYLYVNALPAATASILVIDDSGFTVNLLRIRITSGGILQLWNFSAQLGSDGATLSAGTWYRISLAYTIASATVYELRLFSNGVQTISISNGTSLSATGTDSMFLGNVDSDTTLDIRTSDHYIDNSSSLKDTGDIWVTAKRPNANGTTNGFTGSGAGSGYGTGNSVYVNERALSTASLVSKVGAGSAVTEEYNIESFSTGDMISPQSKIVDLVGWAYMSSLVGETVQFILNGVSTGQAITSTNTMYTKVAGFAGYPASTGADVGITTDTSLTTVSLFECGIMVAFIPATNLIGNYSPYIKVGSGQSRNERAT